MFDTNEFWFDNTRMGDFLRCERNYWLRHVAGLAAVKKRHDTAMEVGIRLHKAWEYWLTCDPETWQDPVKYLRDCQPNLIDESPYKPEYATANLVNIFHCWLASFPSTEGKTVNSVEKPIIKQILPNTWFIGMCDLVLDGYPWDHKTMATLNNSFRNSTQMMAYCWALGVNTAYINACEISLLPVGRTKCPEHHTAKVNCQAKHFKSAIYELTFTPRQLELWAQTAKWCAIEMRQLHQMKFEQTRPKIKNCPGCSFRSYCHDGTSDNLEYKPWIPWER